MSTEQDDPIDSAISNRLARLGGAPIDLNSFDRRMSAQLPPPPVRRRRWTPILATAASLALVAALTFPLLQSRDVQASPMMMAQMYHDMVDGRVPVMHASSLEEANKAIAAMSGNFPTLAAPPASHMMACCMRNIGNKKVACILLDNSGSPVTMVVASASDMESPTSPTLVKDGVTYHVQTTGDLHMVMTERSQRWICLISQLSQDDLVELSHEIRF